MGPWVLVLQEIHLHLRKGRESGKEVWGGEGSLRGSQERLTELEAPQRPSRSHETCSQQLAGWPKNQLNRAIDVTKNLNGSRLQLGK